MNYITYVLTALWNLLRLLFVIAGKILSIILGTKIAYYSFTVKKKCRMHLLSAGRAPGLMSDCEKGAPE